MNVIAIKNRDQIIATVNIIADTLLTNTYPHLPGLLYGNSGVLLFFAYYYKHFSDSDQIAERIEELIYLIAEQINDPSIPSFFATGYSGIGWTIDRLQKIGILGNDNDDFVKDISIAARSAMLKHLHTENLDGLYGFMGDYIFLKDSGFITEQDKQAVYDFFNDMDLSTLIQSAFADKETAAINLGLAHGLASLAVFVMNNNELPQAVVDFVIDKYTGIFEMRSGIPANISVFPNSYLPDLISKSNLYSGSRYAWCYGDLGILYMFSRMKSGTAKYQNILHDLVKACNDRNIENSTVTHIKNIDCYDIGFCHGLAGIVHLQTKINKALPSAIHLKTNEYWLELLNKNMEQYLLKENFKEWKNGTTKEYDSLGVLEGIAGAGLVLISCLTDDFSWDSCFMLND